MKRIYFVVALFMTGTLSIAQDLIITGVFDGPLTGGTPKGVELYVKADIADLSIYGLGSANNGGGTDGEEYTFPAEPASLGDFIYVASNDPNFTAFMGRAADYISGHVTINGDDAVELYMNSIVIDVFGDINTDGSGEVWDFEDGWAYRNSNTGPEGSTFTSSNWSFSGKNVFDGEATNWNAATPFPIGSYILAGNTVTWDGETSADWATASNWDGDVLPTQIDDVVIPNVATDPIVTSDIAVRSLNIASGGLITVSSNSLSVKNNLTIDGSINVASGASLLPLGGITGSGSAIINRNTTFGVSDGQYSVIGSPITTGNTNDLGSIVYAYDETVAYGSNGNSRFSPLGASSALAVADGYFSANTGDISFTGIPNSDIELIPLIYDETNDGGAANAGFNLVSNPFSAAISYDAFVTTGIPNPDIDGTIYLWDDGGSDVGQRTNSDYITANSMGAAVNGATSTRAGSWDGYIRSAQGFFVKATTAGTLNFTPTMMATGNNSDGGFFREAKPETLRLALSSTNLYSDILVGFREEATIGYDRTLDGRKIKGSKNLQLYSRMNDEILAIQALPLITEEVTVSLGFDVAEAGLYSFEFPEELSYSFEVFLMDTQLDRLIDLSDGAYTFETEAVVNSDRFNLVFSPNQLLSIDKANLENKLIVFNNNDVLNIRLSESTENALIKIYDLSGNLVHKLDNVNFNSGEFQTPFNKRGLFVVTVSANNQIFVKKFMK